jgi:hypothetical protein
MLIVWAGVPGQVSVLIPPQLLLPMQGRMMYPGSVHEQSSPVPLIPMPLPHVPVVNVVPPHVQLADVPSLRASAMAWTVAGVPHESPDESYVPFILMVSYPALASDERNAFQSTHCGDVVGRVPTVKSSV